MSNLIHSIENIENKCLQYINYIKKTNIYILEVCIDRDLYEINIHESPSMLASVSFSTHIGYVDGDNDTDDEYNFDDTNQNSIVDYDTIIGCEINKILFKSFDKYQLHHYVYIYFNNNDNDTLFTIKVYNYHNGYYPNDIIVNLYENFDETPMEILHTCV
jgi:hypothetical protein